MLDLDIWNVPFLKHSFSPQRRGHGQYNPSTPPPSLKPRPDFGSKFLERSYFETFRFHSKAGHTVVVVNWI
jgi:hypothetical protein